MKVSFFRSASVIVLSAILSACSSGSGAPAPIVPNAPTGPSTPILPAGDYETAEYNVDWSLDAIHASQAYSKGFTGEGGIIGFVDFNFELDNNEVAWAAASRDRTQRWFDMYIDYLGVDPNNYAGHHGHWVASIAAAKKNDYATHGVAFNAEVVGVDFFAGVNMHTEVWNGVTYHVSDPYTYLYNNGARVFSKSFGYDEDDFIADPPAVSGNEHYTTVDASVFIELGGLVVAAAGNNSDPEPMISNLETLQDAVNASWYNGDGFFIIAGSIDVNGEISGFSDRAGSAGAPRPTEVGGGTYSVDPSQYYLLAPGEDVAVNWAGSSDGVGIGSGTSYAAPHISGAAALLFAYWPQLTAREVGAILLNSATDLGEPGVDAIYGHGLLNLDAATEPLGTVSMVISGATSPTSAGSTMISLGSAFGDATPSGLSHVMLLDSYNRDFYTDISHQVMAAPAKLNLSAMLDMDIQTDAGMWHIGHGLQMGFTSRRSAVSDTVKHALSSDQQSTLDNRVQSWHLRGGDGHSKRWVIGSGAALSDVMTSFDSGLAPASQFYLTGHQAFGPSTSDSYYMATDMALRDDLHLSFGFKSGSLKGYDNHSLALYHGDLPVWEMESRLSKSFGAGSLSFALGALVEKQAVLGSRSSGGLKLASDTRTLKADIFADYALTPSLRLRTHGHLGRSQVSAAEGSLFSGVNDFFSSSWSMELLGTNILASGDVFGFKLSQPLRVENAHATIESAVSFDYNLKAPVFADRQVSLSPTSREFAAEAGYKKTFSGWLVEVNVAERFNAGHSKGLYDTVALLRLARNF